MIKQEFITASKASKIAGPGPETIKRWVRKGFVVGYRSPGGTWYINLESLYVFLKKLKVETISKSQPTIKRKCGNFSITLES